MTQAIVRVGTGLVAPRLAFGTGWIAAILALAHFSNDALTSMLGALLPSMQRGLGLSETTMAVLVGALAFSSSVTQPTFGALADRFGARRVAALGTAFGVSLMSLMTVVPNAAVLLAVLLVGGLGSAAFHPAGTSVVGQASGRSRELVLSLFSGVGMLGLAIGPVLVLWIAGTFGLGFTPWLVLPALALGAVMYVVIPETARAHPAERPPVLDRSLFTGRVGQLAAVATLSSVAFVAFGAGYPLFLVAAHGIAPTDPMLGATLAVFNLSAGAGSIVAAALAQRVKRRALVVGTMAASVVPLGLLLLVPPDAPTYFPLVALAGGLLNASLPALIASAQDAAPGRKAAASGMIIGLPVGLAGLLYVPVGQLQQMLGFVPALAVAFAMTLPAAALALRATPARNETSPAPDGLDVACGCAVGRPTVGAWRRRSRRPVCWSDPTSTAYG